MYTQSKQYKKIILHNMLPILLHVQSIYENQQLYFILHF